MVLKRALVSSQHVIICRRLMLKSTQIWKGLLHHRREQWVMEPEPKSDCWVLGSTQVPYLVCFPNIFSQRFFLMWAIFKVFIEFVTILLLFYVLIFWPWGTWDLNFLLRDRTHIPCSGRWSLITRLPGKSPCFPNFRRTVLAMENPQYVLWFLKESSFLHLCW